MIEHQQDSLDDDPQLLLTRALSNETYRNWAASTQPLELGQLAEGMIDSDDFQALIEKMGWPQASDSVLLPRQSFDSDEDFLHCLVDAGPMSDRSLNSFRAYLTHIPPEIPQGGFDAMALMQGGFGLVRYATAPVLYRVCTVAPDLMKGLHEICSRVPAFELGDYFRTHRDVTRAARLAYELMGRLVTTDDELIHRRLINFLPQDAKPVTDIRRYLSV